jgi:SAM-dependent methyltransferase
MGCGLWTEGPVQSLKPEAWSPRASTANRHNIVSGVATIDAVREYWDRHIHDLEITRHPVGSRGFFDDLDQYHFEKLHHLLRLVNFEGYRGRSVLEVGCGAGVDLARFARGGARVTGVDLTSSAIGLARANFEQQALRGEFFVADGEHLPFPDASFDLVYAHGVVQYTADPARLVRECRRVLKPGGDAIFQVYNRVSWLNALSKLMKVGLEHDDAPVLLKFSIGEFRRLLSGFGEVRIVPERFPVKSRLHHGWKGAVYNRAFVGAFNALPRALVRRFGWHLLAFCRK